LLVTQITDPFGRSATLTYDSSWRLSSITDIIGLTSSFTYDANSLVNSMTTPYGTTSFAYTAPGSSGTPRFLQVTDPLGYNEREEWLEPAPIPDSDPSATVPQGMPLTPTNGSLTYRDSFHWDKDAYVLAGCTPSGGCDYTKARDKHFLHLATGGFALKSPTIESIKYPLENRIWYSYPGQVDSIHTGTFQRPVATGRVLDDGTTQLSQASYDTAGYFKLTQLIDPLGRTTSFAYANHVDLAAIAQTTAYGVQTTVAQFTYNGQHRPIFSTDAAGQTTSYTYNAAGQLASATNPLGQTTTYQYNVSGDLISIINANTATAASFTYDAFDRVRTATDSEGWVATYDYDAADRVTKITYPDGTARTYTYDRLDLASFQDRLGRVWTYTHDANRRLTKVVDPLAQQMLFGYNGINELASLTDPSSNVTSWTYDVEGRLSQKTYADSSTVTYTYENTTSRLESALDALGQTKQYSYAEDDALTGVSYLDAVNATPNVAFAYDPYFPRRVSMTDGDGTTQYSYFSPFSIGALQLEEECFTPTGEMSCSYQVGYAYDALARLASRTVAGASTESFGYDAIGRLTSHTSDLGAFALSYLGQTGQITLRQLASSTLSTAWSYLPNSGDRRLAGINNVGLVSGQYSTYGFTTNAENFITAITEASDAATVYPTAVAQTATYNSLNQLTNLSGQALTFDTVGNLLSDGQRNYSWDAENRLIGITYPAQPGKQTAFIYDGLGRRTAIASTPPGGGTTTTTTYVWCGQRLCQARNASNAPIRGYYAEGEFLPGSPAQSYFYGPDQIGSVRRVFASASSAPAYSYDPYGVPLQTTAALTDFGFAGLFANDDSGLYLTKYRIYDPIAGRWLTRDPVGESGDASANLYAYVGGNPVVGIDLLGRDVTVVLYQGAFGFGHIGVGVAPSGQSVAPGQTTGFDPVSGYSPVGGLFGTPGVFQPDTGMTPISSVTIPTSAAQDAQVSQYMSQSPAGNYSFIGSGGANNCATKAEGALSSAGISTPQTIYPYSLMNGLLSRYGGGTQ
jgi:RHS repeat-associated protein